MLTNKSNTAIAASMLMAVAAFTGSCSDDDSVPANEAPSVTIYSPENFRTFSAGDNIIIHAVANDPNGSVSKLEFYQNEIKIGEVEGKHPYEYTWAGADTGRYKITVVAIDNGGAKTISPEVQIRIKENKLLDKNWQLTGRTINGSEAYTQMDPCEKDNLKIFNPDGTLTYDEYLTKCDVHAAQTEKGSWAYNLDRTAYSEIRDAHQIDYQIISLTDAIFRVSWSENGSTYADTYTPVKTN